MQRSVPACVLENPGYNRNIARFRALYDLGGLQVIAIWTPASSIEVCRVVNPYSEEKVVHSRLDCAKEPCLYTRRALVLSLQRT